MLEAIFKQQKELAKLIQHFSPADGVLETAIRHPEAAEVAFRVGYESASQFSREYSRMFGSPPRSDVKQLKEMYDPAKSMVFLGD